MKNFAYIFALEKQLKPIQTNKMKDSHQTKYEERKEAAAKPAKNVKAHRRAYFAVVRTEEKTQRNAPCPCGSGAKFKKCQCEEYSQSRHKWDRIKALK